ncbi:MAG: NAD+ synthase [Halobacteriota archaeon]
MADSTPESGPPGIEAPRLAAPDQRRRSLEAFVRGLVDDADATGVVVNLSGGIDSSVTASLAVESLGSDQVTGLVLPATPTPTTDVDDALHLAEELVIDYRVVDLQPIVERFMALLQDREGNGRAAGTGADSVTATDRRAAVGNLAARARMAVAYFEANVTERLVLGTGNRTELELGYFTKYGDGGVDALPIGNLYKTQVRDLATVLDVPTHIVEKPPTAGLWEGQTDEAELGATYPVIDAVLHGLLDRALPVGDVADELDLEETEVDRIATLVDGAEHKRRMPPTPGEE